MILAKIGVPAGSLFAAGCVCAAAKPPGAYGIVESIPQKTFAGFPLSQNSLLPRFHRVSSSHGFTLFRLGRRAGHEFSISIREVYAVDDSNQRIH